MRNGQTLTKSNVSMRIRLKKSWQLYVLLAPALIGLILFSY